MWRCGADGQHVFGLLYCQLLSGQLPQLRVRATSTWTALKNKQSDGLACRTIKYIIFCTLRFQIFKQLYLGQILSYPNKPYINGKFIYSVFKKFTLIVVQGHKFEDKFVIIQNSKEMYINTIYIIIIVANNNLTLFHYLTFFNLTLLVIISHFSSAYQLLNLMFKNSIIHF